MTGSGSSFNACLVGKYLLSKYAGINAEPVIASEFKFSPVPLDNDSVLIAVSQSGESADVLEAVKIAQDGGAKVISIVNTMTSSLAHLSSVVIGLNCGPEIGRRGHKELHLAARDILQAGGRPDRRSNRLQLRRGVEADVDAPS